MKSVGPTVPPIFFGLALPFQVSLALVTKLKRLIDVQPTTEIGNESEIKKSGPSLAGGGS